MSQQTPVPRLRPAQLAGVAFSAWFGGLADWLKAVALPLALLYLVYYGIWHYLTSQSPEELRQSDEGGNFRQTALLIVNMIVLTLFAVAWHRRILLGETPRFLPLVSGQHVRYLLWLLILGVLLFLFSAALTAFVAGTMLSGGGGLQAGVVSVLGFASILYLLGRISPLFAGLAVDERIGLAAAWRLTRGQGMALFFGYLLILLPVFFLSAVLLSFVFSDIQAQQQLDPGSVITGDELMELLIGAYWLSQTVQTVIGFVLSTLAVGVASAAYRELR